MAAAIRVLWIVAAALLSFCGPANGWEPMPAALLDVLVIAPHSDDEAIGCTAVMLRAIGRGERVGVAIVTAGDGFPKAAAAAAKKELSALTAEDYFSLAALRQRHSLAAMERVGIQTGDLMFLGYPDGGLDNMYAANEDTSYRQPFTDKTETYGLPVSDYHSRVHGRPAPYQRSAAVADLAQIIKSRQPKEVYVTGESDSHGDHRATFWLARDAVRVAKHAGPLWTYVVHGSAPKQPPDRQLTLSDSELKLKRELLELYQVGVSPVHDRLAETYAQPQELFWKVPLEAAGTNPEPRR
jgi:LmbE family N-acetylglucosaminyl deacetylase